MKTWSPRVCLIVVASLGVPACLNAGGLDRGGAGGAGGAVSGSGGTSGTAGGCTSDGVPADVANVLASRCLACHGATPIAGVPASLATYASLTSPSKSDPTQSNAALALARMQSAMLPMPPAPLARATAAEIAALAAWVAAGTPRADCAGGVVPPAFDPFAAAPTCTSARTWTGGNRGSSNMNPGQACIACHSSGGGPRYTIAGTLYPTGHEPDLCNGASGTTAGAQIVIVGADGATVTLTPSSAGNFYWRGTLALPYLAKVVSMGRERAMIESQTSGDCNSCHTQSGTMSVGTTMKAPGRIAMP
jgi:hypothetical protein